METETKTSRINAKGDDESLCSFLAYLAYIFSWFLRWVANVMYFVSFSMAKWVIYKEKRDDNVSSSDSLGSIGLWRECNDSKDTCEPTERFEAPDWLNFIRGCLSLGLVLVVLSSCFDFYDCFIVDDLKIKRPTDSGFRRVEILIALTAMSVLVCVPLYGYNYNYYYSQTHNEVSLGWAFYCMAVIGGLNVSFFLSFMVGKEMPDSANAVASKHKIGQSSTSIPEMRTEQNEPRKTQSNVFRKTPSFKLRKTPSNNIRKTPSAPNVIQTTKTERKPVSSRNLSVSSQPSSKYSAQTKHTTASK